MAIERQGEKIRYKKAAEKVIISENNFGRKFRGFIDCFYKLKEPLRVRETSKCLKFIDITFLTAVLTGDTKEVDLIQKIIELGKKEVSRRIGSASDFRYKNKKIWDKVEKGPFKKISREIKYLVIHHTASEIEKGTDMEAFLRHRETCEEVHVVNYGFLQDQHNNDELYTNKSDATSLRFDKGDNYADIDYHYLITRKGEIIKGRLDSTVGWHSGNSEVNIKSLAIALICDLNQEKIEEKQFNRLVKVVLKLKNLYKIHNRHILFHREINKNTSCPGKNFPKKKFFYKVFEIDDLTSVRKITFPTGGFKTNSYRFGEECVYDGVKWGKHLGEDFNVKAKTPVISITKGKVVLSHIYPGKKEQRNWGNIIIIAHKIKDRIIFSLYGHLGERFVKEGDVVEVGQKIGQIGKSLTPENGWWEDEHLHFGIFRGVFNGKVFPGYAPPGKINEWIAPSEFFQNTSK